MKVLIEDVVLTYVKPKMTQTVYQYIIVARDEFLHAETVIVDADKAYKEKIEELLRKRFAARYRISEKEVEVVWGVGLPQPPRS